jgi:hypothetical protein
MGLLLVLVRIDWSVRTGRIRQGPLGRSCLAWNVYAMILAIATRRQIREGRHARALNATGLLMQSAEDRTAQNASRCLGDTRYRLVQ